MDGCASTASADRLRRLDGGVAEASLRAVVLVEGVSDRYAVETLAQRRGRDLAAEGIRVVPIGGAQAIGRFLTRFGPAGLGLRLAGLCDAGEEREFRRGLERAGLGSELTREDMERLGFYVCDADLEDELIRASAPTQCRRSWRRTATSARSERSRSSRNGGVARWSSNSVGSWAAA